MKTRLKRFLQLPYLLISGTPFVLMAPLLLGGKAMYWGTPLTQFVPWWTQAWHTLQGGELPLWNPLVGMGAPLLANYQTALLYPPTWLYFLLGAIGGVGGIAWGQALLVALHLAWAGLGMVTLVKRLGWGQLAQTVSGLAFGMSAYLITRAQFLSINAAVAWLPWVLLFTYELATAQKLTFNSLAKLAVVVGLQLLAGHAQTTWYTLLLAGVWAAFWGYRSQGWKGWGRAWLGFALVGAFALALAAVQLLPTAEYLLQSQRAAEVEVEWALTYSFWPWRFLTLFVPDLFGNPRMGDFWGYATYWEDALYIGMLAILLALGGIVRRGKNSDQKALTWFLLAVIAVSFLFALGKNTPVFPWLYRHVPTFDMFQAPARYTIWAVFALALLAGLGVEGWRRPEGRWLYWSRLGTMGMFAVSFGAGLGWYVLTQSEFSFGEIKPTFVPALALAGFWGLGAGVLNLLVPPKEAEKVNPIWTWAVAVFLALDLLVAGWGMNPGMELALYRAENPTAAEIDGMLAGQRLYLALQDEYDLKYERFFDFDTFSLDEPWLNLRAALVPNTNIYEGIATVNNYDPVVPGRFQAWMDALEAAAPDMQERMLWHMDVGAIEQIDPPAALGVSFTPYRESQRVRFASCGFAVANPDDALQLVQTGLSNTGQVVLEDVELELLARSSCPDGEARIVSAGANRVVVQVNAPLDGWLVLNDVWYPGWTARLDGQKAELYKADYLFRAVAVPAGEHQITFVYRPVSFYVGVGLSAAAWIFLWVGWLRFSNQEVRRQDGEIES
ncbi:MAG: YfhO family protein [Anaerolineales bacterium]|nr:YfhO family protein [Anaerolineales bacterium]